MRSSTPSMPFGDSTMGPVVTTVVGIEGTGGMSAESEGEVNERPL